MTAQTSNPAEVLVFETSLRLKKDVKKIAALLRTEKRIKRWSVDLENQGKVLRVESHALPAREIVSLLAQAGYQCTELTD